MMANWKLAAILLMSPAIWSSDAFGQRQTLLGNPLPQQNALNRFKLTRAWWGQATLNASKDKIQYLTLDDDKLYVQSNSALVTAFESESGRRLWATQLGRMDSYSFQATSTSEELLIVCGLGLYALNKQTGHILWRLDLPQQPNTSPTADEDNIYIGCLDGSITAFELKKIRELYTKRMLPQWSNNAVRWRYKTNKEIRVPPVSTGRFVDFASTNGSFYCVTPDKRDLVFQFETDAPISAPIAIYKNTVLVASEDFRVYSLSSENGSVKWQFISGLKISKAPQVVNDDVFITPEGGGMYRLNAKDGIQVWWNPQVTAFVAASPTVVYCSDRDDNLVLLSREDGGFLGSLPVNQFSLRLANDRTDRVYLATPTGLIVALHEQDRHEPKQYRFPERQPILPEFAAELVGDESESGEPSEPAEGELPAEEGAAEEMPAEEMSEEEPPAEEMPAEEMSEEAPAEEE